MAKLSEFLPKAGALHGEGGGEWDRGSSAYTRGQVLNAAAVATAAKPSQAKPILLQLLRRIACLGHRNDFHIPQQLKPLSQGENPIKFGSERNKSELSVK